MKYKHIQIDEYNPLWPKMFETESLLIKKTLGNNCIAVHHVGSTAVPGLCAKPTIDIITVIRDRKPAISSLESIGYQYRGEYNIPLRLFFNKKSGLDVNLHVYQEDHPDIEMNLLFRDYLRTHAEARQDYIKLKKKLIADPSSFVKQDSSYTGYNLGKDEFIREILKRAGFNRLRMMCCTHYEEWSAAKKLRQQYFSEKNVLDNYDWTLNNPNQKHVVLYQGTKIIGYAEVIFKENQMAEIPVVSLDKDFQNKELKQDFKNLLEDWITK